MMCRYESSPAGDRGFFVPEQFGMQTILAKSPIEINPYTRCFVRKIFERRKMWNKYGANGMVKESSGQWKKRSVVYCGGKKKWVMK